MKALFVGLMAMMATVSIYGDEASNLVEISTNYGNIVIELNKKEAPKTVKNFLSYVNKGYYDDTIFHRVIDGFMIQGGGFTEDMVQKETDKPIKNEKLNKFLIVRSNCTTASSGKIASSTPSKYLISLLIFDIKSYVLKSSEIPKIPPIGNGFCPIIFLTSSLNSFLNKSAAVSLSIKTPSSIPSINKILLKICNELSKDNFSSKNTSILYSFLKSDVNDSKFIYK